MYVHFRHHVRLDAILEGALKYWFYLANFYRYLLTSCGDTAPSGLQQPEG